jgi:4-methyl-5(b-hydroxyethyl)-thiazole monophosphate biosynthesis
MKTNVLIPLAEGFEDLETVSIVDILRRGEVSVILASID